MENEIWRPVVGYEGLYEVSNLGRVKSVGRYEEGHYRNGDNNAKYYRKERILKQQVKRLYAQVALKNIGYKYLQVHRLVAFAFPEICGEWFEGAVIDHIDTNPLNNKADNLRWCTQKINCNNPLTLEKNRTNHVAQKVMVACSKDGVDYKCFNSIAEAAQYFNMKSTASITNCLCGRAKTAYGFIWKYIS